MAVSFMKSVGLAVAAVVAVGTAFNAYQADSAVAEPPATAQRESGPAASLKQEASSAVRQLTLAGPAELSLAGAPIEVPDSLSEQYPVLLQRLRKQLGPVERSAARIEIRIDTGGPVTRAFPSAKAIDEAFQILVDVEGTAATVTALSTAGAVQGIHRLRVLLSANDNALPAGEILDWPEHPIRAIHITTRDVTPAMISRVVDQATDAGFNTLIMQYSDSVAFDSPAVVPRRNAMSKQQFQQVVRYVRESGLRFIPEVKLLSHQEKFLGDAYPQLMYNKITYDPRKPEVYELVDSHLNELIELIGPDAIHIGHDEIRGFDAAQRERFLNPGEQLLPAELFLQDVERMHAWLSERGIETWMWGDMLISKAEFPKMRPRHLHGDAAYAALRPRLPRDIVIGDWHYRDEEDFSSTAAFAAEGFRVLGSTWKTEKSTRAFSRAAARIEPPVAGMMATSWWHLRRREWDMMDRIIADSGDAHWYAD